MGINTNTAVANAYANQMAPVKDSKKSSYGKTIGDVSLSQEGAKYYEELKKKYKDMDFILVSNDEVENVEQKAASFANPAKTVVLIDAEKVEKMAKDESYRAKFEGIISGASKQLDELKSKLSGMNGVKGYGMKVNDDGTTSLFAVMEKSSAAQRERIEKKAAEKKADAKAEAKKTEKEKAKEAIEKRKEAADNTVTITGNTIDELINKIQDFNMAQRSDFVQTEQELSIGQNIDFKG